MCGIAGIYNINNQRIENIGKNVSIMIDKIKHRGPDAIGGWCTEKENIAFGHARLSIIDLVNGDQPMIDLLYKKTIVLNGEIYNYKELREELKSSYTFKTESDTEVVLAAYTIWGDNCVNRLRGMFAFVIWDEIKQKLFCARDRFGIKPFYYLIQDDIFYFASEVKAILPFIKQREIDLEALNDYFNFQFVLEDKTLFQNIKQLLPAHTLSILHQKINISKYWEVKYEFDYNHTKKYFQEKLIELLSDSIKFHLRSDVPVGSYLSGGIDSSLVSILAKNYQTDPLKVFTGKFTDYNGFDESVYAKSVANQYNHDYYELDITATDFKNNISNVIYHLDYPVAGPGSFPQYMISKLASKYLKVVLGGQGGDEIFGGYVRYLLAYFEKCIKGAIDGTLDKGNFIVTYESIIPNLTVLQQYKPLMQEFFSNGIFDDKDKRYYKLVNRSNLFTNELNIELFNQYNSFEKFQKLFWDKNVGNTSYFNNMTNFDFKTLLPALLHVEDRMSMASGLESRVPFLDHSLIEFIATIPSNIKFENGTLKYLLKDTFKDIIPQQILNRKDKMGFPVPLNQWAKNELKDFIFDIFKSQKAKNRIYLNKDFDIENMLSTDNNYNRNLWTLLSLELWQQLFID